MVSSNTERATARVSYVNHFLLMYYQSVQLIRVVIRVINSELTKKVVSALEIDGNFTDSTKDPKKTQELIRFDKGVTTETY